MCQELSFLAWYLIEFILGVWVVLFDGYAAFIARYLLRVVLHIVVHTVLVVLGIRSIIADVIAVLIILRLVDPDDIRRFITLKILDAFTDRVVVSRGSSTMR